MWSERQLYAAFVGVMLVAGALTWHYWEPLGAIDALREMVSWYRVSRPIEIVFRAATFLGDHEFYMIFLSILLWCVDRSLGFRAAVMLLLAGTYTNVLKDLWALPRPQIEGITLPGGHAFPSGHTLTAVALWGYLAARLPSRTSHLWMVFAVVAVGTSRLVLGYHFPRDVIGGLTLGLAFLLIYLLAEGRLRDLDGIRTAPFAVALSAAVVLPLILYALYPAGDAPLLMGFLLGAGAGYLFEKRLLRSQVAGSWQQRILRAALGLAGMFGLVIALGIIVPSSSGYLQLARYALVGLWVTWGAPAAFVALGLAGVRNEG